MRTRVLAASILGAALLLGAVGSVQQVGDAALPVDAAIRDCDGIAPQMPTDNCRAASWLRFPYLYNLQGAGQFCKWEAANPGEWGRLKAYAETLVPPTNIVTWFGGAIRDSLSSYFESGAPTFVIQPNTAPNRCKTPLKPPTITNVTPGQTQVQIEISP